MVEIIGGKNRQDGGVMCGALPAALPLVRGSQLKEGGWQPANARC